MRSTLDAFLGEIQELKTFVESIDKVNKMLARNKDHAIRACRAIRRRLDYTSFIISLYTALEKFVEDITWSHTELESSRNEYSDLCKKLRLKHLKQSGELISRRRLGEGRYTGVNEVDIVSNLHKCLSGKRPYRLNRHAVIHHDQNLKSDVLTEVFARLGIENVNDAVCRIERMNDWYRNSKGVHPFPENSTLKRVVEIKLADLVERRNQVSHAGRDLDEYLDPHEMKERVLFIEAYVCSLFDILTRVYIDRYYIKSGDAITLGRPMEGPFKGRYVAVFRPPHCRIFKGQQIVGVQNNQVDRYGYIEEMQVNDSAVDFINTDSIVSGVGLRTDFKLTRNVELYVLQQKDDSVWS